MESKSKCLICGSELEYKIEAEKLKCYYCGKIYFSNAKCKNGHYVCDECHSKGANDIILSYCKESNSKNPLKMSKDLMKHTSIKMHGPEHHFLVPAVLISSFCNTKNIEKSEKIIKLEESKKRAKNVLGGFCGLYGACGAGIGTGIFISVITGATPLSKESWKLSNFMTSKSLYSIADNGGPRCCKRDSFLAIEEAVNFVEENLNVKLEKEEKFYCEFSKFNNQCLKNNCKYFLRHK